MPQSEVSSVTILAGANGGGNFHKLCSAVQCSALVKVCDKEPYSIERGRRVEGVKQH